MYHEPELCAAIDLPFLLKWHDDKKDADVQIRKAMGLARRITLYLTYSPVELTKQYTAVIWRKETEAGKIKSTIKAVNAQVIFQDISNQLWFHICQAKHLRQCDTSKSALGKKATDLVEPTYQENHDWGPNQLRTKSEVTFVQATISFCENEARVIHREILNPSKSHRGVIGKGAFFVA